ncbi:MAG: hypothetical protein JRI68_03950 [Deltaproteobacteria bacterium]|nr:hypothetical protein [Deltaproteobacteria bacterium]
MRIIYALAAALFVLPAACGDEFQEQDNPCEGVPCNEDPWCCPSGQTCAPDTPNSFACLNASVGQQGDSCHNYIGAPECGELLFCMQTAGAPEGVCTWFCDNTNPDRACPNLHHCFMGVDVDTAGKVNVCDPNPPPS